MGFRYVRGGSPSITCMTNSTARHLEGPSSLETTVISGFPRLVGKSRAMHEIRLLCARLATGAARVLITGENGVGKDVVARYIHARSSRSTQPLLAVKCAGVTETVFEAELFGDAKGSFTGAFRDTVGKLRAAHRGTIFLDEVGEMSLRMQALLLRFLEDGEFHPVGSEGAPIRVDVRVIAATTRDLMALAAEGMFREDVMYRLNMVHVHVPPLRERREDIPELIARMIGNSGRVLQLTPAAEQTLQAYHWPGNVRELQNTIEKLVRTVAGETCDVDDLPRAVREGAGMAPAPTPAVERRRQVADRLYDGLVASESSFWTYIHPLFLERDITRHDIRALVRRGLAATGGNYRALVTLFGMPQDDYKKFLGFLEAHGCAVDVRSSRSGALQHPDPPSLNQPGSLATPPFTRAE
jgi:DNA-binding NtrC family response regulator